MHMRPGTTGTVISLSCNTTAKEQTTHKKVNKKQQGTHNGPVTVEAPIQNTRAQKKLHLRKSQVQKHRDLKLL